MFTGTEIVNINMVQKHAKTLQKHIYMRMLLFKYCLKSYIIKLKRKKKFYFKICPFEVNLLITYLLQIHSFIPIINYDSCTLKWTKGKTLKDLLWKKKLKLDNCPGKQSIVS